MLNTFRARSTCEHEAKFVQDRIITIEKTIAEFCHVFAQYTRKAACLRDKCDEISKVTFIYGETENINKSLSVAMENFSDNISFLGSYGDLRIQNLETKVVSEFGRYEDICKHAKDEVKTIYNAREKEIARKRQLDRIKERNPRNRQQIIQAETELAKASAEFSKTLQHVEEKSIEFEKQKIHDIKSILLDFLSIEMGFHARALEVLTNAYNDINSIDEEADLDKFKKCSKKVDTEFRRTFRGPETSKTTHAQQLFRQQNSLGSLGAFFSSSQKKPQGIPKKVYKSEETLDSMKHSISDTEESLSDSEVTESEASPKMAPTKKTNK